MSHNPSCTVALHEALTASPEFTRLHIVGYQKWPATSKHPADLVELRRCAQCGSTLGRELGIGRRLERARRACGGNGDQSMISRCERALAGDESAVVAYVAAVEIEQMMGGLR